MSSSSITNKLDDLLKSGEKFDTRSGLRFLLELVKDAFEYIETQKSTEIEKTQRLYSFETRIKNIEHGLDEWMKLRKTEQEKAEEERKWWRRTIMGALLVLTITELAKWILGG